MNPSSTTEPLLPSFLGADLGQIVGSSSVGSLDSARRVGHYRWLELTLFAVVGQWAPVTGDPALKMLFASTSRHHAWRADVLLAVLPTTAEHRPDDFTSAPSPGARATIDSLFGAPGSDAFDDHDRALARAVGLYRVLLPYLGRAYRGHAAVVSRIGDGPTRRAMLRAAADLAVDIDDGVPVVWDRVRAADGERWAAEHEQTGIGTLFRGERGKD